MKTTPTPRAQRRVLLSLLLMVALLAGACSTGGDDDLADAIVVGVSGEGGEGDAPSTSTGPPSPQAVTANPPAASATEPPPAPAATEPPPAPAATEPPPAPAATEPPPAPATNEPPEPDSPGVSPSAAPPPAPVAPPQPAPVTVAAVDQPFIIEPTTSMLETAADFDTYKFDVTPAEGFAFAVGVEDCDADGDGRFKMLVEGAGISERKTLWDDCDDLWWFTPEESGEVSITMAGDDSSFGDYTITVFDGTLVPVVLEPTVPNEFTIAHPGQRLGFSFNVREGDVFSLAMEDCDLKGGAERMKISLRGAGIETNQTIWDDCDELKVWDAEEDGTVAVTFSSDQTHSTGSFKATFFTPKIDPVPIELNTPVNDTLVNYGTINQYVFEPQEDDWFAVTMSGCDLKGGDRIKVQVMGADIDKSNTVWADCDDLFWYRAESTDTVRIIVTSSDAPTRGTYQLGVWDANPIVEPAEVGTTITGTLENVGQVRAYTFDVVENMTFSVAVEDCDPKKGERMEVVVSGVGIDDKSTLWDDCSNMDLYTAEESGTVTVSIRSSSQPTSGGYAIAIAIAD